MTRYFKGKLKWLLLILVLFGFISLQEQAVAVLNSTSLKDNVFSDFWRKLNSTENDLREVKDQVRNITRLYEGSQKERERDQSWESMGCKISLFTEYCVIARTFLPSTPPSWPLLERIFRDWLLYKIEKSRIDRHTLSTENSEPGPKKINKTSIKTATKLNKWFR